MITKDLQKAFAFFIGAGLLILLIAISVNTWSVGAQGTDDSGGIVSGPPSEGGSTVVDEENGTSNVNPADGDPFVQIGGKPASTPADDGNGDYKAAFAFKVSHSPFAFSGLVSSVSTSVLTDWRENGIDINDFTVKCLVETGDFAGGEVRIASKSASPSGDSDFRYEISGKITQDGTCMLMFRAGSSPDAQPNRDLNDAGVEN